MAPRIRICGLVTVRVEGPPALRLEYNATDEACQARTAHFAQYERILRESLASRGWTARRIAEALRGSMARSAAALLAGDCEALIGCGDDADLEFIRTILESSPGPELWVFPARRQPGTAAQEPEASLCWMEISGDIGQAANRLQAAQAFLKALCGRAATIAVVRFAAGREPHAKTEWRLAEHLRARGPVEYISLYSGWYYALGRLQAGAALSDLRQRLPPPGPALIASASLTPGPLQAALSGAGQDGGFRLLLSARPAAFLPPQPSPRQLEAAVNFLQAGLSAAKAPAAGPAA